jgi:hypothetical protein
VVHAFGAAAEFAGSLWSAQKKFAEDGGFEAREIEGFLEAMLVLVDSAIHVISAGSEIFFGEGAETVFDGRIVEIHGWVAIGFLIAGADERIERKGIVVGSGDFFFDERAEDTSFDEGEMERHGEK